MPPRVKISPAEIMTAALEIVRSKGAQALNARALAQALHCSTQPIFSNYSSMEALRAAVIEEANALYQQYLQQGMQDAAYPPYKASGLAYIRFAREERELFKLLFMRDRSQEQSTEEDPSLQPLLELICAAAGLDMDTALRFHLEMWIYVHGIATMIATSYLDWEWDVISDSMTDLYQALLAHYGKKAVQNGGNQE